MKHGLLPHVMGTVVLSGLLAGGASPLRAADGVPEATIRAAAPFEVRPIRDLVYRDLYDGEDPAKGKNKLDLYLPKGRKDFPVLFFVHGGAWRHGDKDYFGLYSTLGMFWARQGIATVVTNYRLSPAVQHPAHIQDVARAFAWTHKNIATYGGRPDQVFVCGHSAGGHLVSLLATDESYLRAEGLSLRAIRGVIPISGVYDVSAFDLGLFTSTFGKDHAGRKEASPLCHVAAQDPPFLILYADKDFPTCDQMSEKFCKALQEARCEAQTLPIKDRNHITVILKAGEATDPVQQAILKFIARQTAEVDSRE